MQREELNARGGEVTEEETEFRRRRLPSQSILEGHNRERKKLIPPVLGIGNTQLISTIDTIIPEVVWVGLILDWHGVRNGIEVVSNFLKALWEIDNTKNRYRFSELCSNQILVEKLPEAMKLDVEIAFYTFRKVYECIGLDWAKGYECEEESSRRIIRTVSKYTNRFEQPYLIVVSTIIYSMALAEKMRFAPGTLPNIEAIVSNWGSDEAELASCSVRACSMTFFPHDGSEASEDWCKTFWRKNYQMSECR